MRIDLTHASCECAWTVLYRGSIVPHTYPKMCSNPSNWNHSVDRDLSYKGKARQKFSLAGGYSRTLQCIARGRKKEEEGGEKLRGRLILQHPLWTRNIGKKKTHMKSINIGHNRKLEYWCTLGTCVPTSYAYYDVLYMYCTVCTEELFLWYVKLGKNSMF